MKILHISDSGLPDARIERAAWTSVKSGSKAYFCGPLTPGDTSGKTGGHEPFSGVYNLEWNRFARVKIPIAWTLLKKHFNLVLDEIRPDIIHAHNVVAAKLASESRYPFVFDDHECVSLEMKAVSESDQLPGVRNHLSQSLTRKLWTGWEKDLVHNSPTITVSKTIANAYEALGSSRVFVVPNLPNEREIDKGKQPDFTSRATTLSSAYAGKESTLLIPPYREMRGFVDLFHQNEIGDLSILGEENTKDIQHVRYTGYLSRPKMYDELLKHHIGLLPWKSHWFHPYCSPNKVYEYAHSGLLVMLTDDFTEVISMLDSNCATFRNYDELIEKLRYYKDHRDDLDKLRQKTIAFARENLLWEKYEGNITRAYQEA